jgi:hypothetical protein
VLVTTVVQLPGARLERGWRRWVVVVPPLFALMLTTSMWALSRVSIGSFVVARNAAPLLTFALEACHGRERSCVHDVLAVERQFLVVWARVAARTHVGAEAAIAIT